MEVAEKVKPLLAWLQTFYIDYTKYFKSLRGMQMTDFAKLLFSKKLGKVFKDPICKLEL